MPPSSVSFFHLSPKGWRSFRGGVLEGVRKFVIDQKSDGRYSIYHMLRYRNIKIFCKTKHLNKFCRTNLFIFGLNRDFTERNRK